MLYKNVVLHVSSLFRRNQFFCVRYLKFESTFTGNVYQVTSVFYVIRGLVLLRKFVFDIFSFNSFLRYCQKTYKNGFFKYVETKSIFLNQHLWTKVKAEKSRPNFLKSLYGL